MKSFARFLVAVLLCYSPRVAKGAVVEERGTSPGYWDSHCVIVCKINEVHLARSGHTVPVSLLAVVSTNFIVPTSDMDIGFIASESSVTLTDLTVGTTVCACLHRLEGHWWLPHNETTFMLTASGSPIQRISGLDDPKIGAIVEAVNKARRESEASASKSSGEKTP